VRAGDTLRTGLEVGPRRTFATALDWPGWARVAKGGQRGDPTEAIDTLLRYRDRYAAVLHRAGLPLPPPDPAVVVVETLPGGAGTDFGAPGVHHAAWSAPVSTEQAAGLVAMLEASWAALDAAAAAAPETLRKGPRGGGRDRSAIVAHVQESERSYARKVGVRVPPFDPFDPAAVAAFRAAVSSVLAAASDGGPLCAGGWTPRYAVHHLAWHVLDHAWEIEDRVPAAPPA
jgi:hypothetical protein